MAFCSKCGKVLNEGDVFCSECGQPVSVENRASSVQMSVEESIALAEKLSADYDELNKIRDEISDCELELKKTETNTDTSVRYSAFRFFWPFLIIAFVVFWLVVIIGIVFLATAESASRSAIYGVDCAALIAAAIVLIIGGVRARNKRDYYNANMSSLIRSKNKKEHDLKIKLDMLKTKLRVKKKAADEYNSIVPLQFRTRQYMDKVVSLLKAGRAQSIDEALELCKRLQEE